MSIMGRWNRGIGFKALVVMAALLPVCVQASSELAEAGTGHGITEKMMRLMLQLALILIAAKIGGTFFSRVLKLPEVLGELAAGMVISPFALGAFLFGLFPEPSTAAGMAVSPELYGIATLASILLLYLAGLETDLPLFLRYSVVGSMVGVAGVVVSFVLGAVVAVWFGVADSMMSPSALFLGTISTATSVGITARILGEARQLDRPEGVTILAGAVVDDVLGIIVLAVVVGVSRVMLQGGEVAWGNIGWIAAKALVFWLLFTALGLILARQIGQVLKLFKSTETMAAVSFGLALLLAGVAEKAGLAMILGAYIMGLSLSRLDVAHELQHRLQPLYGVLVSIFFCVMGMMVDIGAMKGMIVFGLVYTLTASLAKVIGCSIPPLFMGFNWLGGLRIGIGMLPRGEVALVIAGIGLASGVVKPELFGVVIMMTLITTFLAPVIMVRIFNDRSGMRDPLKSHKGEERSHRLELPAVREEIAEFLLSTLVRFFQEEGCYVHQIAPGEPMYRVRQDEIAITIGREDEKVVVTCGDSDLEFARLMLMEAVASLVSIFGDLQNVETEHMLRSRILLAGE